MRTLMMTLVSEKASDSVEEALVSAGFLPELGGVADLGPTEEERKHGPFAGMMRFAHQLTEGATIVVGWWEHKDGAGKVTDRTFLIMQEGEVCRFRLTDLIKEIKEKDKLKMQTA